MRRGLEIGNGCWFDNGCGFDWSFPYLISIGNNVTVYHVVDFVAHDASFQKIKHVTKLGTIRVDDNVFMGARSTILSNVHIGRNAIIVAGTLVNKNVPAFEVWGGPARYLCTVEKLGAKNLIEEDLVLDHSFIATDDKAKYEQVLQLIQEKGQAYIW